MAMLTTTDNPYNPFTQYDQWHQWDADTGYNTCEYLARITITSDDLSEIDQLQAIDMAIDEIIEMNVTGKYKKVTEQDYPLKPPPS